ncbi:MAG: hypothetical protein DRP06_00310 [Candidatus Aenigmatarchaeota archaeon]|nr:MAG: hypothetical protein DRP06_00310 [Candidatus Aenigmarchaeota archaeon]
MFLITFWIIPVSPTINHLFGFLCPIIAYPLSCLLADNAERSLIIILISLFLIYFIPIIIYNSYYEPNIGNYGGDLKIKKFIENCEGYCKKDLSLKYCTNYFKKNNLIVKIDWGEGGGENELIKLGIKQWNVCEPKHISLTF